MAYLRYQKHVRIGMRGNVNNTIMCFDEEDDRGHYLHQSGHGNILSCPFDCNAEAEIEDAVRQLARVITPDDPLCQGAIQNWRKFSFCSLAENGRLAALPSWSHRITLCAEDDPIATIINNVAQVRSNDLIKENEQILSMKKKQTKKKIRKKKCVVVGVRTPDLLFS